MALTELYTYNQHFVAMMNLINSARLAQLKEGHNHHIVPKCWFKMNGLPVDNSKDNRVLLSYTDHCKIHKLAYLCARDPKFKGKMAYAYHRLSMGDLISNDCFKGVLSSRYGVRLSEETRKKMSESHKGQIFSEETRKKLSESKSGQSHPFYGKHHSELARKRMSEAFRGKTWKLVNGKRVWI